MFFYVDRSFKASWGSFLILRAELEGFEELVRMGVWDFSFIISASDLPLRSVDDMAAMLAPYRGEWWLWGRGRVDLPLNSVDYIGVWDDIKINLFSFKMKIFSSNIDELNRGTHACFISQNHFVDFI